MKNLRTQAQLIVLPKTYCAVAADKSSQDTLWFIKINNNFKATNTVTENYENHILAGLEYMENQCLEKAHVSSKKA